MNTITVQNTSKQLTITLKVSKVPNLFIRNTLLGLIILNVMLSLIILIISFIEGFEYLPFIFIPVSVGYYFLRTYLWNMFGKEIIQITPNNLKKWNDYKYFKYLVDDADFKEIEEYLLFNQLDKEIITNEIPNNSDFRSDNQFATLKFILHWRGRSLEIDGAVEVPLEAAEQGLQEITAFFNREIIKN